MWICAAEKFHMCRQQLRNRRIADRHSEVATRYVFQFVARRKYCAPSGRSCLGRIFSLLLDGEIGKIDGG